MDNALAIYQAHLDRVSDAVWTGDDETLVHLLALPNRLVTSDAEMLLTTAEELIEATRDFRHFLIRSGAQEYHRIVQQASFHPRYENRIDGSHKTYVMRGGRFALDPYLSHQVLICEGGVWRGIEIRAEVRNADCTVVSPEQLRKRDLHPPATATPRTGPPGGRDTDPVPET